MKYAMTAMTLVLLAGCTAGVFGSKVNVQQIGRDSYTVRVTGATSTAAKQGALGAANGFCTEQKRNVQLVKEHAGTEIDGSLYHDVTFLCIPAGDDDFVRVRRESLAQ